MVVWKYKSISKFLSQYGTYKVNDSEVSFAVRISAVNVKEVEEREREREKKRKERRKNRKEINKIQEMQRI